MKNNILLWLLILSVILSACGSDVQPSTRELPSDPAASIAYDSVAKRQELAAAQTAIAQQQRIEKAVTAAAIARVEAAQASEQAFDLQQRKAAATATIAAVQLAATVAAQDAQATTQARSAEATASAISAQQTRQAVSAAASATASAQGIQQNLEKAAATATQQAIQITIAKAESERARSESDAQFYNGLWRVVALVILTLLICFGAVAFSRWLIMMQLRSSVLESRSGTLVFVGGGKAGYTARLVGLPDDAPRLMPGDESEAFDASQAKTVDVESTFIFNHNGKSELVARPVDETYSERQLVLRLLRESSRLNGWQSGVIATAKELKWSGDTRNRAIDLIRDYIATKEGRNGGTFIGARHKTLLQLYSDVGARRIVLASQNARVAASQN